MRRHRQGRPVGDKAFRDYLEVQAYANAADRVYAQGRAAGTWTSADRLSLTEVRHIHELVVAPVWQLFQPDGLLAEEGPGGFRRHDVAPFPGGMVPPRFPDVAPAMTDWLVRVNTPPGPGEHLIVALAAVHAAFERIHPFRDGNGRAGRLVLNLLLVRAGYPPAILRNRARARYLAGLRRADSGDPWPLAELLARAVKESLDRFLFPNLAGPLKLLPLSALAATAKDVRALRAAADRGRLRSVKEDGGRWLSTRQWVADYRRTARVGRPRKGGWPGEPAVT